MVSCTLDSTKNWSSSGMVSKIITPTSAARAYGDFGTFVINSFRDFFWGFCNSSPCYVYRLQINYHFEGASNSITCSHSSLHLMLLFFVRAKNFYFRMRLSHNRLWTHACRQWEYENHDIFSSQTASVWLKMVSKYLRSIILLCTLRTELMGGKCII